MIFLALLGKIYFFFPKVWSYTLDGKWKMIFLKKIHGNMIFSSNFLKRWSFQKGPCRHMIFLVLSRNMMFSPWTESERRFSQEIHRNMAFSLYTYGCSKRGATPLCQKKKQRWFYPAKIHLKVIDVLDWHPRKSFSNSLYFHGDFYRRFHALLSSEEKQES